MRNFPRVHPKGRRAIRARIRPVPARLAARYNHSPGMLKPRYALVAYVKSPAEAFVENLRRELHPDLPHMPAPLTILPPRLLQGPENAALQLLDRPCCPARTFAHTLATME